LRVESGPDLRGDGWQATELRYQGPDRTEPLAMTLIMPDDLTPFESKMSGEQLTQIASDLTKERKRLNEAVVYAGGGEMDCGTYPYSLDLFMPRFKIGTRAELGNALKTLGMPIAFDAGRADFSGIHAPSSGGDVIHIENVIHQANIDVDEEGTEAAAATAIGADTGGCTGPSPGKSITLRLDHPFMFALRDIETGRSSSWAVSSTRASPSEPGHRPVTVWRHGSAMNCRTPLRERRRISHGQDQHAIHGQDRGRGQAVQDECAARSV
jgi:hypothetical protein